MKKIIPLFSVILLLVGCTQQNNIPTLCSEFSKNAVIKVGDFSYNADIKLSNNTVYVTATSTNAKGLTISCDGKNVTYSYGKMMKSVDISMVSKTNPAILIYNSIYSPNEINLVNGKYIKTGMMNIGKYSLTIDKNGIPTNLEVNDICINFTKWTKLLIFYY